MIPFCIPSLFMRTKSKCTLAENGYHEEKWCMGMNSESKRSKRLTRERDGGLKLTSYPLSQQVSVEAYYWHGGDWYNGEVDDSGWRDKTMRRTSTHEFEFHTLRTYTIYATSMSLLSPDSFSQQDRFRASGWQWRDTTSSSCFKYRPDDHIVGVHATVSCLFLHPVILHIAIYYPLLLYVSVEGYRKKKWYNGDALMKKDWKPVTHAFELHSMISTITTTYI
ncbi:hypothetical protein BJ508DRAFT_313123 [Ascobolus immersus RN42]|uniref:Uncharacterized protein n=1 Tax=Ascobolus immersus RN42 TaxID=1160509 RepID=A0A3N4HQT7_ASCIM|nr:hypothetical protein BJ508DRAFT_313123 [Ascobolus immersus RN42]